MLLNKLSLVDVGIYKGSQEFDFQVKNEKPIILYGGTNGAGKTTLFESIPLCLYGQNFGNDKITKKQYHEKIHRLFHRDSNTHTSSHEAKISLEFRYAKNGKITDCQITRTWQNNEGKIDEFLNISQKDKSCKKYTRLELDESQIQDLINQMIPREIAGLFFFDGEKIQDIAQTDDESVQIKSSFDSLLGLDLSSQLYDDISLYVLRNSDDEADAILAELEKRTAEKKVADEKLGHLKEKCVFLKSEIDRRHKELSLKEGKFFKMGGRFAEERHNLMNEKAEMESQIQYNENCLRDIVGKDLPLMIVSEQLEQVKEELESDKSKIKASFQKDTLDEAFADLEKRLDSHLQSYDKDAKKDIIEKFQQAADEKLETLSGKQRLAYDFSLSDMDKMLADISLLSEKADFAGLNYKAHIEYEKQLDVINAKLSVTPKQDEVGPLYSEIKNITLEIGEMEQELDMLEKLQAQEKSMIVLLNSKIRKCLQAKKSKQHNIRGLELAPKIQDVLDDYSQRLRSEKIRLLESNILRGIQKCFYKDRFISKISIDSDTYKVTMYRDNGDEITREQLSKGELQMYATAIIWGLARTSGRPLPFVIDTPLARLDEEHRENMVRNFYPTAAHQTIIFSTNTEIVKSHYEALKPYTSKIQLIQYDAKKDGSLVGDGYFGEGRIGIR